MTEDIYGLAVEVVKRCREVDKTGLVAADLDNLAKKDKSWSVVKDPHVTTLYLGRKPPSAHQQENFD